VDFLPVRPLQRVAQAAAPGGDDVGGHSGISEQVVLQLLTDEQGEVQAVQPAATSRDPFDVFPIQAGALLRADLLEVVEPDLLVLVERVGCVDQQRILA
jgi:hypothetical protein